MNYNIIYKCRRCEEEFIIQMSFERYEDLTIFLTKDQKSFHQCFDEYLGVADLIGSGEIVTDK